MSTRRPTSSHRPPFAPPAGLGWTLLAFGVFFLGVVIFKDTRLAVFGERADGSVVRAVIKTSSSATRRREGETRQSYEERRRRQKSTRQILTVRYTPAGGEAVEFDTTATFGRELAPGDPVPVIYLPGNPRRAEIHTARQLWLPMAVGYTVGGLLTAGGLLILRSARRRRLAASPPPAAAAG